MTAGKGKLLTAEQSVRLAALENVERDELIAAIVAGLRKSVRQNKRRLRNGAWSPQMFYAQLRL